MPNRPSTSIVVAAVFAIGGSLLALLGTLFAILGLAMAKNLPNSPPLPAAAQSMVVILLLVGSAAAIFGVVTGIALLRLKNWARISVLVFAGLAAAFSLLIIVMMAVLPFPTVPGQPLSMPTFMRIFMLGFYSVPLGISIWWLVLFTRQGIVAQFTALPAARYAEFAPDSAALPAVPLPQESVPSQLRCPLPVMVVAGFFIFSCLSLVFVLFSHTPMIIFGRPLQGQTSVVLWILASTLYVVIGIGLFRVRPWSLWLAITLQSFWILSGVVTMANPRYEEVLREQLLHSAFIAPANITPEYVHSLRIYGLAGVLTGLLILAVLLIYRSRFLAAARADAPFVQNVHTA